MLTFVLEPETAIKKSVTNLVPVSFPLFHSHICTHPLNTPQLRIMFVWKVVEENGLIILIVCKST